MTNVKKRDYNKEGQDLEDRKYCHDFDFVFRHYMIRAFEPFPSNGKALEMGCHIGEFTEILTKHYEDLTVIEAASNHLKTTQKRVAGKVKFIHSTFEEHETEQKYDAIFLMHTLEHLDDRVGILRKVNSWLTDDGKLFLVVPNANAASRQIAVKMGLISHNSMVTPGEYAHGHRISYTFDTLECDARAGGLDVLYRTGIFFKPLANFQFDLAINNKVIDDAYLEGCYQLGMQYPELAASLFLLCGKGKL